MRLYEHDHGDEAVLESVVIRYVNRDVGNQSQKQCHRMILHDHDDQDCNIDDGDNDNQESYYWKMFNVVIE